MWPPMLRPRRPIPGSDRTLLTERTCDVANHVQLPAMLGHAGDMAGYAGTLQSLGAEIAVEQAALQSAWQGDTGITYQAWQAQWNQAMEDLVRAYHAMSSTHEANTMAMMARDTAEAAKWGG